MDPITTLSRRWSGGLGLVLVLSACGNGVHHAAWDGDLEAVREFVENGGSTEQLHTVGGGTIVGYAAGGPNAELVRYLIELDAKVNAADGDGAIALHYAAREGRLDNLRLLIAAGSSLDWIAVSYRAKEWEELSYGPMTGTPLHWAVAFDQLEAASLLVGAGADISVRDTRGLGPLHTAAIRGNPEIASMLLDAGASVNATSRAGISPLHLAVRTGDIDTVRILLQRGADPNAVGQFGVAIMEVAVPGSGRGLTPLDIADGPEMEEVLRRHGAR